MKCEHGYEIRQEWSLDQCRTCWVKATTIAKPPEFSGNCRHLQLQVIHDKKDRLCEGCWVMGCEKLGRCTRATKDPGIPFCLECEYRQEDLTADPDREVIPVILENRLCAGDHLAMTAAVHALHETYPNRYAVQIAGGHGELWEGHKVRDLWPHELERAKQVAVHYNLINKSDAIPIHFIEAYCRGLGEALGINLTSVSNRPRVVLSDDEKKWTNQVEESFGYKGKFWLINAGCKGDYPTKWWGTENFQSLVDLLRGRIQFVQIGRKEDNHPALKNVFGLVGKTSERQLLRLCHHSSGGVGPSTFLQHAIAAFEKPYVCLAGGREPVSWLTYPKQTTFHTVGKMDCCRDAGCWKSKVVAEEGHSVCSLPTISGSDTIPLCLNSIRPEEVAKAILSYL